MEKILETKLQITDEELAAPTESVLRLNQDCLMNIFKFLNIKERISAERGAFFECFFKLRFYEKHEA